MAILEGLEDAAAKLRTSKMPVVNSRVLETTAILEGLLSSLTLKWSGLLGWAGQGTNSLTLELGKGSQKGRVLTMAPVPVSLLACDGKSVELEDTGDPWGS